MRIFIKKDEKELLFDLMQLSDTIESSENHKTIAVKQSSQQWKLVNLKDYKELPKILNDFFSNIMKSLNIPQTNHSDLNFENVRDPTLKAILKCCNPPVFWQKKRKD